MKIGEIELEVKPLTRSQRKVLRKSGVDLKKKALEFQNLFEGKEEGWVIQMDEIPLTDDEVDAILDAAFPEKEKQELLEEVNLVDCIVLAGEVFMACLSDPAKN